MTIARDAAEEYRAKGWEVPFALPHGAKKTPPRNTTGGIDPQIAIETAQKDWEGRESEQNVGLRMQGTVIIGGKEYEPISIDVDDYDEKHGGNSLDILQSAHGPLIDEQTYRSTRRGSDTESAQYFFLVPKGLKWRPKIGESIEICQIGHRYSVVWPSVKDGDQYKWYQGDHEVEIPRVEDLQILPDGWVTALRVGARDSFSDGSQTSFGRSRQGDDIRDSYNWLRDNIPNFGKEDRMSPVMAKHSDPDHLAELMAVNAHDNLIIAVRSCVRLATESHEGLKLALKRILETFIDAGTSRAGGGRRSEEEARREFGRALAGEIEKTNREIEQGKRRIVNIDTPIGSSPQVIKETLGGDDFDPFGREFGDHDAGNARLFVDSWGQSVLPTNETTNREFAVWSGQVGRYIFRSKNQMYRHVEDGCSRRIELEADKLNAQADTLEARVASGEQLNEDDPAEDAEALRAKAKAVYARADALRNTVNANRVFSQLHSDDSISVNVHDFDAKPGLIGFAGAETLDMNELMNEDSDDNFVRTSAMSDMLTMTTGVRYEPGAKHPGWTGFLNKFLPDNDLREFTQKVLGYSLLDGNPRKLIVFLIGPSNTGKTTMLEACAAALGDYSSNMNANKLFAKQDGGPNPEFVNNASKLMVFLSEVGNTHELSADTIKQVTGNDRIQARALYSNETLSRSVRFTPYVSTNTSPTILGGDAALANRVIALPFRSENTETPDPSMDVRNNPDIYPAILAWLVEGAKMYREEGLNRAGWPKEVIDTANDFMSETSLVHQFIAEKTVPKHEGKSRADSDQLFLAWQSWCNLKNINQKERLNRVDFDKTLRGMFRDKEGRRRTTRGQKNVYVYDLEIT